MKQIFTGIEIDAPIEKVWAVLTNFEEYPKWNPFIKLIDGEVKEGLIFKVTLEPPDSKPMIFKPKCLKFEKNKKFKWLGHLFIPGIFDGEHIFELIEMNKNKTNFIQKENFKGLLVPFLWKQLNTKTRKGFELMNEKLKELSETI
ncbi:MAG: SRPBCC domain-containing protein [Bacteroidales bacterium]|nr:SRPBCC domain-containing protein [Bacteroidales bacterium]